MLVKLRSIGVRLEVADSSSLLAAFHVRPVLVDQIKELQAQDPYLMKLRHEIKEGQQSNFSLRNDGAIILGATIMCVGGRCIEERDSRRSPLISVCHASREY